MKRDVNHIMVGVGAIIVDDKGRLLVALRGPQARNERGLWEFPGGTVEYGEKLKDTLRREMKEELDIDISIGELLDVVDSFIGKKHRHWISPTFICKIKSGKPVIREPEKCIDIGWFFPSELPANLTSVTRENLKHYKQYLRKKSSG